MKNNKKMMKILALIIIVVAVVVVIFMLTRDNSQEDNKQPNVAATGEEFVTILEDGTKLNTSDKLQETKIFEEMEISDLQLTEKDNVTLLLGTITNISTTKQGGYPVDITIIDKEGNEIITVAAYFGELGPGESTQLSTSATADYANAYDFKITKRDV